MNNALTTKTTTHALQKAAQVEGALQKVGFKKVMILDLNDGAFTDQGVKVRPHKAGAGVVLKCTSKDRLLKALAQAGIEAPIKKGGKHWIADPMADLGGTELVVVQK